MRLSADLLRTQFAYNAWANRRLVAAASLLSPEDLTHDFRTADHSVLGTLVHVFASERLWLARLRGGSHPGFVTDADRHLAVLENDWPALAGRWDVWLGGLTDESANASISYHDLKGIPWTQRLGKLVLHVVNHGTHHRGQVSGFLRALGHTPPALDLTVYYRETD